MKKMQGIREAMMRLSCIECIPYHYDPDGQIVGEGPIHYLVELGDLFFIAWENNDTGNMILNPITRFSIDELDELGAGEAWMVLRLPAHLAQRIDFREISNIELNEAYLHMARLAIAVSISTSMYAT